MKKEEMDFKLKKIKIACIFMDDSPLIIGFIKVYMAVLHASP